MFDFPAEEQKILKFWQEKKIFDKLRQKNQSASRRKKWSFLDGPITANNPMGVHHAWGRTYKDIFQRHKAMKGFDQRYQNGFDCQGLWVEVEVEKELGFKTKKDIEKYGIDKFVEKCKERVKKYSAIQTQQSIRLGQWMDWENSYYTMSDENNYSIWHFLKKCSEDGLLYKSRDAVPWCPRCGTAISQHEILTEEYKLITHKAVYFKLPILDEKLSGANFLVWTTTPWTIPANVALAVNPNFTYGIFQKDGEKLLLLKSLGEKILKGYKLTKTIKGKSLKGLKYQGPFDDLPRVKNKSQEKPNTFHTVVLDKDLVTDAEGTGIVHIAPGAGEEDFKIGKKEDLAVIDVIDEAASYLPDMAEFSGKNAKQNPEIIFDYLKNKENGRYLFKLEDYEHRYPTCWRCKQELVWRVVDEWYISMEKLRKPLMEIAKKINWIPSFGKERELDWLKNMHDWLISKKRYWGLALPIFECECGNFEVIGSKQELKERAVEGWDKFEGNSPHRPWVDNVKIKCKKCKKLVSRIKDVGNPWLDAGIVPFSTMNYLTDSDYWKEWFPAELVCESFPGQFKNWFYSLLVMSAVLEKKSPVKTIFGYASVKDEQSEEMHKSKGNAIWFDEAVQKVGADPMRWMYAKQNPADNLKFGYNNLDEVKKKLLVLYNVYVFFGTYIKKEEIPENPYSLEPKNLLDKWILSKLDHLISSADFNLEKYDIGKTVNLAEDFFITDLSLWYLRRSRKRFKDASLGKKEAVATLYYVLFKFAKLIAPVMPFFAEAVYQNLKLKSMQESIHLQNWPEVKGDGFFDMDLEEKMDEVRQVVNMALAARAEKEIKVRQPLLKLKIKNEKLKIKDNQELLDLVKDEVNVKEIVFDKKIKTEIELDLEITKELKEEGVGREIIRQLQGMRKELGMTHNVLINLSGTSAVILSSELKETIQKESGAKKFVVGKLPENVDIKKEITIDGEKYWVFIKK